VQLSCLPLVLLVLDYVDGVKSLSSFSMRVYPNYALVASFHCRSHMVLLSFIRHTLPKNRLKIDNRSLIYFVISVR
jgi:hypothetical protein